MSVLPSSTMPVAPSPQRQLRWGRVIGALVVLAGIIATAIWYATR
jgi:hypothetical protein